MHGLATHSAACPAVSTVSMAADSAALAAHFNFQDCCQVETCLQAFQNVGLQAGFCRSAFCFTHADEFA